MLTVCGDIHGEFVAFIKKIKSLDLKDCSVIQAGDFGLGFSLLKKELSRLSFLNSFLSARNIQLYAIRGNHDNPMYFNGDKSYKFSNITLVPDYTILPIEGRNVLFVGGAISVDRKPNPKITNWGKPWSGRKQGSSYWSDEGFVLDEEKLRAMTGVDTVITHSAPSFLAPTLKIGAEDWFESDPTLEAELDKERSDLSNMHFILAQKNNVLTWCYAHFHFSNLEIIENTKYKLLDIYEFYEIR